MVRRNGNKLWVLGIGILGIAMSSIFVKFSQAPAAMTAAYRMLWTVVLMTPVVFGKKRVRQELFRFEKKKLLLSLIAGIFLAGHFVLWFESLNHTSVASSTTIVCTEVIWVALGFCLFLKGRLTARAIVAIAVTIGGSVLIALSDSGTGGGHLYGDLLALAAAIVEAVYTLIGTVVRKKTSTAVYTYVVYAACAACLLLTCLVQGYDLLGYGISAAVVGLLLAVFSTILGHSIFSWCLRFFSPAFVSACKLCEPVVAAIVAMFLFSEFPAPVQILGSLLILGGVYCYSRLEQKNNA
jgi:drug/metabolite transporter (DMT)-like permease